MLITDYFDYYRLAAYIGERTTERIGIVMGVPSLIDLFDEKNHSQLPGGILESFGRLFKNGLKLYVYPYRPAADDELRTVYDIKVQDELQPLYDYLYGPGKLRPPGQLPARVPADLQPRRAAPDRRAGRLLGDHGPRSRLRPRQEPRVLRLRPAWRAVPRRLTPRSTLPMRPESAGVAGQPGRAARHLPRLHGSRRCRSHRSAGGLCTLLVPA